MGEVGGRQHPPLVSAHVDHDDHRVGPGHRELAAHGDIGSPHEFHTGSQRGQVVHELAADPAGGVADEHEHGSVGVGEEIDGLLDRAGLDGVEGGDHVGHHGVAVAATRVLTVQFTYAFDGRTQLTGEILLDRILKGAEPVISELGGQPYDGGCSHVGVAGEIGNRAERHQLGAVEYDVSHPALGGREERSAGADALGHLHPRHHTVGVQLPEPPERSFASDNAAGAHPEVMAAMADANRGHALAYGADEWTRKCAGEFRELFGTGETYLCFSGTGGNILSLLAALRPADAVVCAAGSHINVDEAGAAETIIGAKLIDLPAPDGKLVPDQVRELAWLQGNEHHAQPAVLSLTQSTEMGTLYSPAEIAALGDAAHSMGMKVHVDGARIANATAALGATPATLRSMTVDAGVDVITFGGTKNGMVGGEAVVFLEPSLASRAAYLRKTITQLPSKMRFIAAQFSALLADDLWITGAAHANAMATTLYDRLAEVGGITVDRPAVNSLFPVLPVELIAPLQEWSFFWDWDVATRQVRWMTSWDTTPADVDRFVAGVTSATEALASGH